MNTDLLKPPNTAPEVNPLAEPEPHRADVAEIMKTRDVLFVHGIVDDYNGNSPLMAPAAYNFRAQVGITLALRPALSVSTTREGDNVNHIWSSKGVVLGSGEIVSASARDQGTIITSIGDRVLGRQQMSSKPSLEESINKALDPALRSSAGYNEFVVADPQVACLYFAAETPEGGVIEVPADVAEASSYFGLPMYVLADGRLHQMVNGEQPTMGPPVDTTTLSSIPNISREVRTQMIREIVDADMLKTPGPERDWVYQSQQGRATYLRSYANIAALDESSLPDVTLPRGEGVAKQVAQLHLSQSSGRVATDTFLIQDGKLSEIVAEVFRSGSTQRFGESNPQSNELPFVPLPRPSAHEKTKNFNPDDPIETVGDTLNRGLAILRQLAETGQCGDTTFAGYYDAQKYAEALNVSLREVGFYLHGLKQEAERFDDEIIINRVQKMAEQLLPATTYQQVLADRIDANGKFRVTSEDLRALGFAEEDIA